MKSLSKDFIKLMYLLNISELQILANIYEIDITVYVEQDEKLISTGLKNRKETIITKIVSTIKGKLVDQTIIRSNMLNPKKRKKLTKKSRVYYNQYRNFDSEILKLMKSITDDQFKFGSISTIFLRDWWTNPKKRKPPTYQHFAKEWLKRHKNISIRPEWAYMKAVNQGMTNSQWKSYRANKSELVIKKLMYIASNLNKEI